MKAVSIFFSKNILMKWFWFPPVNEGLRGFLFFFDLHKNADFSFQNDFVLWNTIVKLMKVVLNSILIPSSECVSPENFEKLNIKMMYSVSWAHFEVLINLQMDISITENLYKKSVFNYIDYFNFFQKYFCI